MIVTNYNERTASHWAVTRVEKPWHQALARAQLPEDGVTGADKDGLMDRWTGQGPGGVGMEEQKGCASSPLPSPSHLHSALKHTPPVSLLCTLPRGHRQKLEKPTVLPEPDTKAEETGPVLTQEILHVLFGVGGSLLPVHPAPPKCCCIREGVQGTHCIECVHYSMKFKTLMDTEIRYRLPGNPCSPRALQGTLANSEVSLPLPPGGTRTHGAH